MGFGREVRTAIVARRQWLVEQQLATGAGTNFRLREGALENLRQRELAATGKRLSEQLGKKFEPPRTGERIEGVIARRVYLDSGQIRRASCRERVCQYVYISVVAVSLKQSNAADPL